MQLKKTRTTRMRKSKTRLCRTQVLRPTSKRLQPVNLRHQPRCTFKKAKAANKPTGWVLGQCELTQAQLGILKMAIIRIRTPVKKESATLTDSLPADSHSPRTSRIKQKAKTLPRNKKFSSTINSLQKEIKTTKSLSMVRMLKIQLYQTLKIKIMRLPIPKKEMFRGHQFYRTGLSLTNRLQGNNKGSCLHRERGDPRLATW